MFETNDKVYMIDIGTWNHKKEIKIIERKFVKYLDMNMTKMSIDGETALTVQSWAVSPTIDDATKFAVTYLIMTEELKQNFNQNSNVMQSYENIEKKHPDLIFKYMDKVVETF